MRPQGPTAWVTREGRPSPSQTGALSTPSPSSSLVLLLQDSVLPPPGSPPCSPLLACARSPPKPRPLCLASPRSPPLLLLLFPACCVFLSLSTLQVPTVHPVRGPLGPPYVLMGWAVPLSVPEPTALVIRERGFQGSCWGAAESRKACFVGLPDLAIKLKTQHAPLDRDLRGARTSLSRRVSQLLNGIYLYPNMYYLSPIQSDVARCIYPGRLLPVSVCLLFILLCKL